MSKPWVYIASPYTCGDQALNVRFQAHVFDELLDGGLVVPIAPLWSHFQHVLQPRPYHDWILYDAEIITRVDALLRLNAVCTRTGYFQSKSEGADREVAQARNLGIPVFFSIRDMHNWVRTKP